jgi:4-amino-4-deoxy-L-arabinose transferase-like glycosyltransferase
MTTPPPIRRALLGWLALGLCFAVANLLIHKALGWKLEAADLHWDIATQWAQTGVFGYRPGVSTLVRGPTFIAYLVPFALVSGGQLWGGIVATSLARAVGGFVVSRVTQRFASPRAGLVAGLLWFCNPFAVHYDNAIESESMSGLLLITCVLLLLRWREQPSWRRAALVGLVSGLALLAKTTLATFIGGFGLVFLVGTVLGLPNERVRVWRHALLATGVAALCIAPWTARNYVVSGTPYLVQAHFRANMVFGDALLHIPADYDLNSLFSPGLRDMYDWANRTQGNPYAAHEPVGEAHLKPVVDPMLRDPAYMARKAVTLAPYLWYLGTSPRNTRIVLAIMLPCYLLALFGCWWLVRRPGLPRDFAFAVLAGLAAATIGHAFVLSMFRYLMPFLVSVSVLCGIALQDLLGRFRSRHTTIAPRPPGPA